MARIDQVSMILQSCSRDIEQLVALMLGDHCWFPRSCILHKVMNDKG